MMKSANTNTETNRPPASRDSRQVEAPAFDAERLFDGRTEIQLRYQGEIYRLRITRNGKLLLNK